MESAAAIDAFAALAQPTRLAVIKLLVWAGPQGMASGEIARAAGAPASTMYFLNTDHIALRPHKDRNMVPLDPDRFSVNQDAMVKLIGWAGNMTMSNARLQGVLRA
jgi:hypothetical protein